MRIFLAGSTGVIGRALVPRLIAAGHEVVALTRSRAKSTVVEELGARAALADPLDRGALHAAVVAARPEVIVHQLTALTRIGDFRKFDQELALTNRFRTEVTDTLLAAAREVGARRFLAQSFCGWPFARTGGPIKTEEDPLDPCPPPSFRRTLAAIVHLERAVTQSTGLAALALRYGMLYGPGTALSAGGAIVEAVRRRALPLVGDGAGVWSFLHVEDAATATVAAVERGAPGLYNVVDDEPAPVSEWLPHLARTLGAPRPRRVPAWLARLAIGAGGVSMMTRVRGGSNARAKRELGWTPRHASWRQGFVHAL